MLHVTEVKYLEDYTIRLSFDDGSEGDVNLFKHLSGSMFEPLKDKNIFSKVRLDQELGTVLWPNGADFAPEFLRSQINQ